MSLIADIRGIGGNPALLIDQSRWLKRGREGLGQGCDSISMSLHNYPPLFPNATCIHNAHKQRHKLLRRNSIIKLSCKEDVFIRQPITLKQIP